MILQIAHQPFTLPANLQKAVAGAAIVSATAVLVYIVQLFFSVKQFKRQFDRSDEQFRLLNQGLLTIRFEVYPLHNGPPPMFQGAPPIDFRFSGLTYWGNVENVGRFPVKYKLTKFITHYSERRWLKEPPSYAGENILMPGEKKRLSLLEFMYDGGLMLTIQELLDLGVTGHIVLEYEDLIEKKIVKTIDQRFSLIAQHTILGISLTSINDKIA